MSRFFYTHKNVGLALFFPATTISIFISAEGIVCPGLFSVYFIYQFWLIESYISSSLALRYQGKTIPPNF